jgi:hypothetical protein
MGIFFNLYLCYAGDKRQPATQATSQILPWTPTESNFLEPITRLESNFLHLSSQVSPGRTSQLCQADLNSTNLVELTEHQRKSLIFSELTDGGGCIILNSTISVEFDLYVYCVVIGVFGL